MKRKNDLKSYGIVLDSDPAINISNSNPFFSNSSQSFMYMGSEKLKPSSLLNRLVLFDFNGGKVECSFNSSTKNISRGMLVEYSLKKNFHGNLLENFELLSEPSNWVLDDIYFFHNILEISCAFIPYAQPLYKLFSYFKKFYQPLQVPRMSTELFRKFMVCKLFFLLDLYEEEQNFENSEEKVDYNIIYSTLNSPLGVYSFRDNPSLRKRLISWLCQSINRISRRKKLKTLNFLFEKGFFV